MTLFGPDGSTWQTGIIIPQQDWDAIDFMIWRCVTEGGSLDNTWLWSKQQAEEHNKPFLAYSFLSADPRNLDEAVERTIIDKSIPVMCDWEKTGCTTDEMFTWVYDLRAKGYKVPLLYTGMGFWLSNGSPTLSGHGFDLVVARYGDQSSTGEYEIEQRYNYMNAKYGATWNFNLGGLHPVFWQYGSRLRWGDRYMDMNAFRGTKEDLSKWFKIWNPTPPPVGENPPPVVIIPSSTTQSYNHPGAGMFVQLCRSNGEVFSLYENNVKMWQPNDGTLERFQSILNWNHEDSTIHEYPDLTLFGALGQVFGELPEGHDRWGNKIA